MEKVKLSAPITVGDKQVDELELDLSKITGADIMLCINEAAAKKGVVVAYHLDSEVHLQLAARVSGVGRELLLRLPARDFNRVLAVTSAFFLEQD